jgi:CubicO group peptidase (beta-lactamase class C family)
MGVLSACSAVAAFRQQPVAEPAVGLERIVNEARLTQRLPGLAVVVVRSDGQPMVYVSGERRIGKGDPMTPNDRMHLGSLTKAITATVIGALVEQRRMTFEATIGQTFPELSAKIQPAYRNVTARQLLGHASGVSPYRTRESLQWMLTLKGTATEQRRAFLERVLAEPPRFEPGTRHEYSNVGGAIAGAMAERIAGSSYRQLVQDLVFARLGGTAAFGNPGLASTPQPWGHARTSLGLLGEVAPDDVVYTTPLAIEPAGDVSLSPHDYGRFLQLHLRGLRGRDDVLTATTIQELHKQVAPVNPGTGSAMGWSVMPRGVESHEHVGSYGAYVAFASIQASRDVAVAAFTNLGGGQDLRDAVGGVALQIAARFSTDAITFDKLEAQVRTRPKGRHRIVPRNVAARPALQSFYAFPRYFSFGGFSPHVPAVCPRFIL